MDSVFSLAYLVFFAGACLAYFIMPRAARPYWLLVCSCLFYMYDPQNAGYIVLLLSATAVTWAAALGLERARAPWARRLLLAAAVALCLGCLFYYKYFAFLGELFAGLLTSLGLSCNAPSLDLIVPVGISYFTFAALGYVVDVYRGKTPAEKDLLLYALFVSFFPCIVTGPIGRAGHMLAQLRAPRPFEYARVSGGLFRILWGFFKKFVVANILGTAVDAVYGSPHYASFTGPIFVLASLLYTYQLYCDFSASCDIAIGGAAVLGFEVAENFRQPLRSCTFVELWRRWHITLTNWFRDYLYIPLGGNRKGAARQYINQLLVFLASGLWHGASLSMAVWGLLNGIYLCVGKATREKRRRLAARSPLYRWAPVRRACQMALTYLLFTSCIVFFRAAEPMGGRGIEDALFIYSRFFTGWGALFADWASVQNVLVNTLGLSLRTVLVLAVSITAVEALESTREPVNRVIRRVPFFVRWPLYYALVLAILFFGSFANTGAMYGRF